MATLKELVEKHGLGVKVTKPFWDKSKFMVVLMPYEDRYLGVIHYKNNNLMSSATCFQQEGLTNFELFKEKKEYFRVTYRDIDGRIKTHRQPLTQEQIDLAGEKRIELLLKERLGEF